MNLSCDTKKSNQKNREDLEENRFSRPLVQSALQVR